MERRDRDAIILTGATGFLGRELLWKLMLDAPAEQDILCLIREGQDGAETAATAAQRLERLMAEGSPLPATDARRQRVLAIAGDITQPLLGQSQAQFAALAARCVQIFHGAATVRFDQPLAEAQRINVEGTRTMLQLALAAKQAGRLERFNYIGTAYVAGQRRGVVREDELYTDQTFHNTYEQTKAEAEALVREHLPGTPQPLPVTLYRPSIIVGDSKSGYTSSFKVMYWPLKIFSRGLIPIVPAARGGRVDLVPVDYVVDAICALSQAPVAVGRCYHLAAGPQHETTIGASMEQAAAFFHVYKPLLIDLATFEKYVRPVLRLVLRGRRRQALDTGRVYVPYLNYQGSFDTQNARRDLAPFGLQVPDVSQYFERLLRYCVDSDWGKKQTSAR